MSNSKRGFAAMDPVKQREIASKGGRASQATGRGHQFTETEARIAGRLGGAKVSQDRFHMAEIGRRGGAARGRQRTVETA
jgi:general stress protein YciG